MDGLNKCVNDQFLNIKSFCVNHKIPLGVLNNMRCKGCDTQSNQRKCNTGEYVSDMDQVHFGGPTGVLFYLQCVEIAYVRAVSYFVHKRFHTIIRICR